MDKPRNFFKDTYHHLYNRGASKQNIFFEEENFLYFLRRLKYYKEKYKIEIIAYCLMPNHFHLFVKQKTDGLSISKLISSLLNSYTKSINKKYKRSGSLFESKTKSKQITDESYFKWVIKYILDNPVKAGFCESIDEWEYSNANVLFGKSKDMLTDAEFVSSNFDSRNQMIEFLTDEKIKVDYEF
jgi:putative transposase